MLEFVPAGGAFPVGFTATGGPVTAVLAGFGTEVHCSGSEGDGAILGPRASVSNYFFTGCRGVGGEKAGAQCKSEGADAEEIVAEAIEADLVYIDQAKHEVGMLLNPSGGVYGIRMRGRRGRGKRALPLSGRSGRRGSRGGKEARGRGDRGSGGDEKRQEEEAKLGRLRRTLLSTTLMQCRKPPSKHQRVRCEKRAKQKYGSASLR